VADKETGARARLQAAERAKAPVRLHTFLENIKKRRGLSRHERLRILDQAILLLEMNYVHLPLKRAMHAINPVQRLKLLKYRLETKWKMEDEMQFHKRLLEIFSSLRDLHTRYLLPSPFRHQVAFLPFLIEQYYKTKEDDRFLVSRIDHKHFKARSSDPAGASFTEGVEVRFWNGTPVRRAIEMNGESQSGSNVDARFARGLDSLTIRPLRTSLPPDEMWVDVTYRGLDGKTRTLRQDWLVYEAKPQPLATKTSRKKRAAVDVQKTKINQIRRELFAPRAVPPQKRYQNIFYSDIRRVPLKKLGSKKSGDRKFGYIRLFTFEVGDQVQFVDEFKRVITADGFPQEGLIIDVRGNPGGRIRAGERLLQLFTPRRIKPELFEFINTPLNLEICQDAPEGLGLSRWVNSIEESVVTGATYSLGFPLTSEESCNDIGQVYYGPVLLITDALSYSTTDMFAAGFQDNNVGVILGASDNTGAGGANVWQYDDFMKAIKKKSKSPFKALPRDTGLMLAIRRSIRVGQKEGRPLEELGITPNRRYYMTKRDLRKNNQDLITEAARILNKQPVYSVSVKPVDGKKDSIEITATSKTHRRKDQRTKILRVDVSVDNWPYKSFMAQRGILRATPVTFEKLKPPMNVLVQAFDFDNRLVAAYRHRQQ
jgi:C-terminal processing protease CtpA/Prc